MKFKRRYRNLFIIHFIWALLIASLIFYELGTINRDTETLAFTEARANFNKDVAIRHWAALHGGVYVPTDSITPPNPGLTHIAERDIITPSGKKLTLMNPAYMIRQLNETFHENYGVVGHITSKVLIRDKNVPDAWELEALNKFEEGVKEVYEYSNIDNKPYLRLMQPMVTEQKCLKCHAHQGYQVGDIRGGVSISIPMQQIYERANRYKRQNSSAYMLVWLVGAIGIIFGFRKITKQIDVQKDINQQLRKSTDLLTEVENITKTGGWEMDLITHSSKWTKGVYDIVELDKKDQVPSPDEHIEYYLPEYHQMIGEKMQALIIDGEELFFEAELKTKTGKIKWCQANGRRIVKNGTCTKLYGTFQDITQQKHAEIKLKEQGRELEESEMRHKKISTVSSDYAYAHSFDKEGNLSLEWHFGAFKKITGFEPNEIVTPEQFSKLIHPDDLEKAGERVKKLLKGETVVSELRIITKNGAIKWIRDKGVPEWDENKKRIVRVVSSAQEVTKRKKAEEELNINRNKLEKIFEVAPTGIGQVHNQMIMDVNNKVVEMTGYEAEELNGQSSLILYPSIEEHEQVGKEIYAQIAKYGTGTVETQWEKKNGKIIDVLLSSTPLDVSDISKGTIFTALDITEEKKAHKILAKSEQKFRVLFNDSPTGIYETDAEGKCLRANNTWQKMAGMNNQEALGDGWINGIYKEDRQQIFDNWAKYAGSGKSWGQEYRFCNNEGILTWVYGEAKPLFNENNEITGYIGTNTDISQRKQDQAQLNKLYEEMKLIFDNDPTFIFVKDTKNNHLKVSDAVVKMTGKSKDEIEGKPAKDIFPKLHQRYYESDLEVIRSKKPRLNYIMPLHDKDGKEILTLVNKIPILNKNNEVSGLIIFSQDVTQLKQSQERLSVAIEGANMGTWEWNLKTDDLIVNERWYTLKGYQPGEINLTMNWWKDQVQTEDLQLSNKQLSMHMEGKTEVYQAEFRAKHKMGHWVWIQSIAKVVDKDQHGNAIRISGIHLDISARKEYEEKIRKLNNELLTSEEKEKRRIAVNLHDHLGQSLALTMIKMDEIEMETMGHEQKKSLRESRKFLAEAIDKTRSITYDLSPPILYEMGLEAALEWKISNEAKRHDFKYAIRGELKNEVNIDVSIVIFRAFLEIINNIVKHAAASFVNVEIKNRAQSLEISVIDNGKGFDIDLYKHSFMEKGSFGIYSLKERLKNIGCGMEIKSELGKGTEIVLTVPLI